MATQQEQSMQSQEMHGAALSLRLRAAEIVGQLLRRMDAGRQLLPGHMRSGQDPLTQNPKP
jgi:hypothetical protein